MGVEKTVGLIVHVLRKNGRIFVCGNGGSAEQADHFAAEMVGGFKAERRGYDCYSLCANVSLITALANDYSYDEVFSRQIWAHGRSGDLVIVLSTSGRSKSVVRAMQCAGKLRLWTVALTGPGHVLGECDEVLESGNIETSKIQEDHLRWLHEIAEGVENGLSGDDRWPPGW